MAVPRPLLLAVLGLLLLSATFMATRNAGKVNEASEPASQPAAVKAVQAPSPKAADKTEAPVPKPAKKQATASANNAERTRPAREKPRVSKPQAVSRAVASGRVVVLAFFQSRGADDAETRDAVAGIRRRRLAAVYTDSIDRIGRYGSVVGNLGIHQAPAVVIIDAKKRARLVEGYVDPESLAQEVSDARR